MVLIRSEDSLVQKTLGRIKMNRSETILIESEYNFRV